jgi:hypothetical protein
MARFRTMFGIGILLLGFGIFFGMEITSKGMERVHGPIGQAVKPIQSAASSAAASLSPSVPPTAKAAAVPQKGADDRTRKQQPPASIVPSAGAAAGTQRPTGVTFPEPSGSLVETVGNKTGDLLQILAHHSIDGVVSFFDGIFK